LAIQIPTPIAHLILILISFPSHLSSDKRSFPFLTLLSSFLYTSVAGRPLSLSLPQGLYHQPQTCNSHSWLFCPLWLLLLLPPLVRSSIITFFYLQLQHHLKSMDPSPLWINPQPHTLHAHQWITKLTFPTAQTQTQPDGEGAAMSDQSGNVVTFNTADVYKGKISHPFPQLKL